MTQVLSLSTLTETVNPTMSFYSQGSSSRLPPVSTTTEFDVLKAAHKFLRDEDQEGHGNTKNNQSWEDQVAKKYYDSLYREFGVCDLKHYKSGNFALRWRTEDEVISGRGEETCGNTRCKQHVVDDQSRTPERSEGKRRKLNTVELPFAYEEHGEQKAALVKVVLCDSCLRKLMWKREKDKEKQRVLGQGEERKIGEEVQKEVELDEKDAKDVDEHKERIHTSREHKHRRRVYERDDRRPSTSKEAEELSKHRRRRRSSRSLSPVPRRDYTHPS